MGVNLRQMRQLYVTAGEGICALLLSGLPQSAHKPALVLLSRRTVLFVVLLLCIWG